MKNTQTSKNAKHQHAVVICPIIGMRNVKFKIGDKVWFVPDQDGCTEPKFGEVIGITANILKGKGRGDVSYTILDDDENQHVVNHDHVHAHELSKGHEAYQSYTLSTPLLLSPPPLQESNKPPLRSPLSAIVSHHPNK